VELVIRVPSGDRRFAVLGEAERNLKLLREALGIKITARDGTVRLGGDRAAVTAARDVLLRLHKHADRDDAGPVSRQQLLDLIAWATTRGGAESGGGAGETGRSARRGAGDETDPDQLDTGPAWGQTIDVYAGGRPVRAKTPNQQAYLDAIRDHDLVFGLGPAGTGKTYLAVAAAVHLLKTDRVRKLVLVRPAVEAGEKLGFLPGDMQAKVNPYLRPLFDALHDMMDYATINRFVMSDVVEVAPLAFMRGRTLNRAVIILDEAQNTTRTQMKMFLTRMGQGSKMVVTGDLTQIDLPNPDQSGLLDAERVLRRVRGVGWTYFGEADIVRHDLVQRVVEAYAADEPRGPARPDNPKSARAPRRMRGTGPLDGPAAPASAQSAPPNGSIQEQPPLGPGTRASDLNN
jgi:phosphate starvation-inducible PhoH-like protein